MGHERPGALSRFRRLWITVRSGSGQKCRLFPPGFGGREPDMRGEGGTDRTAPMAASFNQSYDLPIEQLR
jgi:hypothetical protein